MFAAWREYVKERLRKSARVADAVELYRRRLLKQGTSQWFTVSANLSQMRMKFAAENGAKVSYLRFNDFIINAHIYLSCQIANL